MKGGRMKYSLFLITALIGFATTVLGQHSKISRDLLNVDPNSKVDIIVQFKKHTKAVNSQKVINLGGVLKRELRFVGAGSYLLPAATLQTLAADPDVAFVSPNRKVHKLLDNTTAAVNAPAAWSLGWDGSGIGVAVIDSGISPHDDLQSAYGSRVVFRASFVSGNAKDGYGHGEHVAGILAGNGADSLCANCTRHFSGIAPNAKLIDLRVLDANGDGNDSSVIAAIDEAIALQPLFNIRVINLSLGRPVYESYALILFARLSKQHGGRGLWWLLQPGMRAETTRRETTATEPLPRPATIPM